MKVRTGKGVVPARGIWRKHAYILTCESIAAESLTCPGTTSCCRHSFGTSKYLSEKQVTPPAAGSLAGSTTKSDPTQS